MSRTEDRANRRITKAFIEANPVCVVLTPYTKEELDTGGWKYIAGEAREEQTMRLIDPYSPAPIQKTIDGLERTVNVELMGETCSEMAIHDRFTQDGIDFEVTTLWNNKWGANRAWAVRRG
jgi:hypothetical protein